MMYFRKCISCPVEICKFQSCHCLYLQVSSARHLKLLTTPSQCQKARLLLQSLRRTSQRCKRDWRLWGVSICQPDFYMTLWKRELYLYIVNKCNNNLQHCNVGLIIGTFIPLLKWFRLLRCCFVFLSIYLSTLYTVCSWWELLSKGLDLSQIIFIHVIRYINFTFPSTCKLWYETFNDYFVVELNLCRFYIFWQIMIFQINFVAPHCV